MIKNKEILFDKEDSILISKYSWRVTKGHNTFYARAHGLRNNYVRKTIFMHRLIMSAKAGQYIDHINGDGLDNRKSNLRFCTNSQNGFNRKSAKNSKSGIKGIYWCRKTKSWAASICVEGSRIWLGRFKDKKGAGQAYRLAAKKYHGEFAKW